MLPISAFHCKIISFEASTKPSSGANNCIASKLSSYTLNCRITSLVTVAEVAKTRIGYVPTAKFEIPTKSIITGVLVASADTGVNCAVKPAGVPIALNVLSSLKPKPISYVKGTLISFGLHTSYTTCSKFNTISDGVIEKSAALTAKKILLSAFTIIRPELAEIFGIITL